MVSNIYHSQLCIGPFRLTQKLLPLLRENHGRIINMGSIAGKVALPGFASYSASKFALEGFTDSLRREVEPFGVAVSLVEPGAIETPLFDVRFQTFCPLQQHFLHILVRVYMWFLTPYAFSLCNRTNYG